MAHLIDFQTGEAAIAYVGETPWHGLGHQINPKAPIEEWLKCAKLDWTVKTAPVEWIDTDSKGKEKTLQAPSRHVLYRSDTHHLLNVVSSKYNVVQPREILEFYRDLVKDSLFSLETAGALKDGGKVWALAKANRPIRVKGNDVVNPYLLLATSTDGSLSTTGKFTSVRVVCNNTLTMASAVDKAGEVRVPHHSVFNASAMKQQLGVIEVVSEEFEKHANRMAKQKMSKDDAVRFFLNLLLEDKLGAKDKEIEIAKPMEAKITTMFKLFQSGRGHDLPAANDTLWGAVNAVTEYVDWHASSKSTDNRINSAWFGVNARLKQDAWAEAMKMAA